MPEPRLLLQAIPLRVPKITARELMADPKVQLALHEKQLAALDGANVDPTYMIMGIRDTVERCRGMGKAFNPVTALQRF